MGRITNIEAKKKANHVVSSGSGGSSKGPSIIDKRNQELPCPYCSRIFTQTGRLKDHVTKHHAAQANPGADAASAPASATPPASTGASAANSSRPAATPAAAAAADKRTHTSAPAPPGSTKGPGGSSAPLPTPASAAAVQRAGVAQGAGRPGPGGLGVGGGGVAAGGEGGGAGGVALPRGGIMDVGSKAGYYTCKSPKLHLHEWCDREKRPKPRFSARPLPTGLYICKVVLPDPKKAEDDLVLFLDEAYAAAELWEAEQRAAVTALQRVAGDRGYDSLLPKQFVGMWRELGEVHARRKAESEARAAAQKEAQQRMRAASQKSQQRAPQVLTMSREKQAAVQAVLRERLGLSATPMAGPGAAGRQKSAAPSAPLEPDLEALVSQGFKRELVVWAREGAAVAGWGAVDDGQFAAASQGLHPTGSGAGGNGRYQAVLEWLLVACSPDQIPPRFTVGASNAVTRITPLSRGASSLNGPDDDAVAERFDPVTATALLASVHTEGKAKQVREASRGQDRGERLALAQVQAVARLAAWGYDDVLCEEALAQASQVGDEEAALCWLFDRLTGRNTVTDSETPSAACSEAWAEEVMVLDAIFDDAVTSCEQGSLEHALQFGTNETHTASTSPWSGPQVVVRLPLPDPCPVAYQAWELQEGDAEGFKDTEAGVVDTHSATLTLLFRCVGASAPAYPDRAPLIAASCPSLRPKHLRRVTRALAAAAEKLLGQPMLHDLAMLAVESVGEMASDAGSEAESEMPYQQPSGRQTGRQAAHSWEDVIGEGEQEEEEGDEGDQEEEGALASTVPANSDADDEQMLQEEAAARENDAAARPTITNHGCAGGGGGRDGDGDDGDEEEGSGPEPASLVTDFEGLGLGAASSLPPSPGPSLHPQPLTPAPLVPDSHMTSSSHTSTHTASPAAGGPGPRAGDSVGLSAWRGRRSTPSPSEQAAESQRMLQAQLRAAQSPQLEGLRRVRASLPAARQRGELLAALVQHGVLVISGATGCGKSTQVPQYILEESVASGQGAAVNIIVTQPRRISALGLAQRVAQERGEEVGETVGYSVRLDSRTSPRTRLLFCTTGILLRRLLSQPLLDGVSHVVLDEVHERSIEIDLLLLLLRDVMVRRSSSPHGAAHPLPPLQLVLMSATADAQLFAQYMQRDPQPAPRTAAEKGGSRASTSQRGGLKAKDGVPLAAASGVATLTIPGFTYPVREMYLEDVLELTGHVIGTDSRYARKGGNKGSKASQPGNSSEARQTSSSAGAQSIPAATSLLDADGEDAPDSWDAPAPDAPRHTSSSSRPAAAAPSMQYSAQTLRSLSNVDEEQINYEGLADLVAYIVQQQQQHGRKACMAGWQEGLAALEQVGAEVAAGGAVLVFLPGAPEISRAQRCLRSHSRLLAAAGGQERLQVLALHGALSARDQSAVFVRYPAGTYKIVLATNVAETSITIDDVTFVIDTGRAKEMQHDPDRGILRLQEQWVSQAAALQRRGRAGRVRPGVCFRLFSRRQWGTLPSHTAPEMLRSPLESVVLLIKGMAASQHGLQQAGQPGGTRQDQGRMSKACGKGSSHAPKQSHSARREGGGGGEEGGGEEEGLTSLVGGSLVAEVLAQCLSPPKPAAVQGAVGLLRQIGALDGLERLTPLGHHLTRMPMDPRVAKMLVFGAMLSCLDPVLTIAAAMAHGRPVFLTPAPDMRGEVEEQRRRLLSPAVAARSDHVALVAAFNSWVQLAAQGGPSEASGFAQRCALSESSLEAVASGRQEYAGVLAELGFLPHDCAALVAGRGGRGGRRGGPRASSGGPASHQAWLALPVNAQHSDARFLKAAVMAGFYPSVLRVEHPPATYIKVEGGAVRVESEPSSLKFFDKQRGRAFIHPGSVNFKVGDFASGWAVYTQMTATTKLFVRESSMAPMYSVALFGGELRVNSERSRIMVDDVAEFQAPALVGVLLRRLRMVLDSVLAEKIQNPGLDFSADRAVGVIMQLLATDGF